MPRQPFLPTFAGASLSVGPGSLNERPDFATLIGKCIGLWSYVDNELANLLSIILGAPAEPALELFLTIRRARNQLEAVSAVAAVTLKGEELLTCKALMGVYGSLERQRNDRRAHGCFGHCPSIPGCLLWINVKDHIHFQMEALGKGIARRTIPIGQAPTSKGVHVCVSHVGRNLVTRPDERVLGGDVLV